MEKRRVIMLLAAVLLAWQAHVFAMWTPDKKIHAIISEWNSLSHGKLLIKLDDSMDEEIELRDERIKTTQDSPLWEQYTKDIDMESIRYCTIVEVIQLRFIAKTEEERSTRQKRIDTYIKDFKALEQVH